MRDLNADKLICDKAMEGPWIRRFTNNIVQYTSKRGICSCGYQESGYGERIAKENDNNMEFIAQAREGWPEAIERAIKAEAEVKRLTEIRNMMRDDCAKTEIKLHQDIEWLQTKNAKLRAVVDAARVYVTEHDKIPNLRTLDEWIIIVAAIRNALAELDEEKGQ